MSDPPTGRPRHRFRAASARPSPARARDEALERLRDEEDRQMLLVEASHALLSLPDAAAVVPSILALTQRLFRSQACGVWRLRPEAWELVAEVDRSAESLARGIGSLPKVIPEPALGPGSPQDLLPEREGAFFVEGFCAPLCLPLTIQGERAGTLAVYHREPHPFTDSELRAGRVLANLTATAMTTAELDEEQRRQAAEGLRAVAARASCLLWYAEVEDRGEPTLHWTLRVADEEAARRFLPVEVLPGHTYGEALSEARLPEDRARMAWGDEEIRAGRSYRQDFRVRDAAGGIRWLEEDVQIESKGPDRWYAVGVCVDVTERQRLQEALRQRAEELAEADRRKDEFLAMLAHELRNPLGAIANGILVLQHPEASETARDRALSVLDRQVRHQRRIVADLLDVSRITRGLVELRPEPLDLAALASETVEDYRAAFRQASVELDLKLPDGPLAAVGDRVRLSQILGNLLSNGLKFTPPGGRVHVEACLSDCVVECLRGEPAEPATDPITQSLNHPITAVIRVRDTGIGIPTELLPHVFDSFTQGDRSLARTQEGLGLGLALVRALVELHGGSVAASSDGPGKGSEFVVRLPLPKAEGGRRKAEGPNTDPASSAGSVPPSAFRLPPSAFRTVLVVEDNRDAAETIRDLLELAGHAVELAHTGPEGIEAARRSRPDVVVCDIGLPGMDGYALAAALRQEPFTAGARLIAVSGYGQDTDRLRAREAGFDHHLVKPIVPEILFDLVSTPGPAGAVIESYPGVGAGPPDPEGEDNQ